MKKKIRIRHATQTVEQEVNYIPLRYILALVLAVLETVTILAILVTLCIWVPYFYLAVWATQIACVIRIIASDDNPDYKVPWLLFVLIVPIAGFMLYFLFYNRTLKPKYVRRLKALQEQRYRSRDEVLFAQLYQENEIIGTQARMLTQVAGSHLFSLTKQQYFPLGEDMHAQLLDDLRTAEKFIFMEYFIIEEGKFWNSILDILKEKAARGVEVRVVYDDIGCMMTLPGNYDKVLGSYGIDATPFSKLKGNADSEFNNRSHRKITVIDGRIGYTGGINIADEYINERVLFGHWKDVGIRLEGEAVRELCKLFLIDYGINVRHAPADRQDYFPDYTVEEAGWLIPFGDGPEPIFQRRVGKTVLQNMLSHATRYFWAMSPYLILDNETCQSIENAALRGVDVKLILPGIPDKKLVLEMARGHYRRLIDAGVEIYEYTPGFVHAKCYLADDTVAMVGTINLDYRSLVHNFENGVWMYRCQCLQDIRQDFLDTLPKCRPMAGSQVRWRLWQRLIRSVAKVFAPLM